MNAINLSFTSDGAMVLSLYGIQGPPGGGGGGSGITALTGDVTASGTGSVAATIANGAVSLSKMADLATSTILGRMTSGTGAPEALTASQVRGILNVADGATANASDAALRDRSTHTGTQGVGTITGLAAVATSGSASDLGAGILPVTRIADGSLALAKQANIAASTMLGNNTVSPTAPIALTLAQVRTLLNVADGANNYSHPNHTGDVTSTGDGATVIAADAVTNAKLANVATGTIKGRSTAGTGDPEDLTGTQATALLDVFTSGAKGLVPASGGGTTNFLRADGTFAAPGGGGTPGGSTNDIQINSGGAFAGASDFKNEGGQLRLPAIATPATPAASGVKFFGTARAGRIVPAFIGPDGLVAAMPPEASYQRFYSFNDMILIPGTSLASQDWQFGVNGSGAAIAVVGAPVRGGIGWVRSSSGTTTTGRNYIWSGNAAIVSFGSGACRFRGLLSHPVLSNGTETFTLRIGFIDSVSGETVDGAYFRYTHSVAGGNWQAVTRSNNVETGTATDTGVAAATGANFIFEIDVNEAGTEVVFKINGTVVATHVANIPTGSGRETGFGLFSVKSAGTTSTNTFDVDYLQVEQLFSAR